VFAIFTEDYSRRLVPATPGWGVAMNTAELILEKARKLPDELQQEALHYVDSLLARQAELNERHN
jgi:hypothetical protein